MDRSTFQRIALFGGPIGYIALGLVHPMSDPKVGDATDFFVFLHVVQPVLIGLMAYALWTLVEGLPGRAAKVARFAVVPYAIAYTMFDSIIGVAKGVFAGEAGSLSAADQAVVASVLETDHWLGYAICARRRALLARRRRRGRGRGRADRTAPRLAPARDRRPDLRARASDSRPGRSA